MAASLPDGIQFANRKDVIDLPLMEREPLGGREREHPPDQRQVDPVVAVIGKNPTLRIRTNIHTYIVSRLPKVLHLLVGPLQTSRIEEGQT